LKGRIKGFSVLAKGRTRTGGLGVPERVATAAGARQFKAIRGITFHVRA
jgi:hypothetical protein